MLVFWGVHLFDNQGLNLPFMELWGFIEFFKFSSSRKTKAATTHTPRKTNMEPQNDAFQKGSSLQTRVPILGVPTVSFGECTSIDALLQL